jgi:hypothetical protein
MCVFFFVLEGSAFYFLLWFLFFSWIHSLKCNVSHPLLTEFNSLYLESSQDLAKNSVHLERISFHTDCSQNTPYPRGQSQTSGVRTSRYFTVLYSYFTVLHLYFNVLRSYFKFLLEALKSCFSSLGLTLQIPSTSTLSSEMGSVRVFGNLNRIEPNRNRRKFLKGWTEPKPKKIWERRNRTESKRSFSNPTIDN